MMERPFQDNDLRLALKRYDPVPPPSHAFLAALEADIITRADAMPHRVMPSLGVIPPWMVSQGWGPRASIMALALIVTLGFIAGRVSYGAWTETPLLVEPSLLAFADESSVLSVPATESSWGDDNDQ